MKSNNENIFGFENFTQVENEANFCLWETNSIVVIDKKPVIDIKNMTMRQLIDFLIFPKQKESKSLGSSINSMASTVFYNFFIKHKKLNLNKNAKVTIYDTVYTGKHKEQKIRSVLSSIVLMTYRNGMNAIRNISTGKYFNTDCGWGCTIRSAQMMLSKALIEFKKQNFSKENKKEPEYMNIIKFREEVIALFADNNIPIHFVLKLKDFDWIFNEIKKLYLNPQKKPLDFKTDVNAQNDFEIKAPFSIRTICHFTQNIGKWSSVMVVIQSLIDIAKKAYSDITLIHYPNGIIAECELLKAFSEEIPCTCDNPFQLLQEMSNEDNDDLDPNNHNGLCEACLKNTIENNENSDGTIMKYDNKIFRFKNKGIIFVTVRLGLKYLENSYVKDVKQILKIHNNIGFIGGKEARAFYFIGHSNDDEFLFLDPHFNQDAIDITCNDYTSYSVENLYMISPSEMSPEITFGVLITKGDDLINCLSSLKAINKEFIFIK